MAVTTRSGLSDNFIEIDTRLSQLEIDIREKAAANTDIPAGSRRVSSGVVPRVSGVRVSTAVVGGLFVSWSAVDISNLQRYEVQISSDGTFASLVTNTINTTDTTASFPDGEPGVTYFAKVRAFDDRGAAGEFSETINTKTGEASSLNIQIGATSNLVTQTLFEFPVEFIDRNKSRNSVVIGATPISTIGGVVLPFVVSELYMITRYDGGPTADDPNRLTLSLLRDGEIVDSSTTDFNSTLPRSKITISGFTTPDLPDPGDHLYELQFEIYSSKSVNTFTIEFEKVTIELLELRR